MKSVIIYSTPTCPYCKLAKVFLDERGVSYEEKDIAADLSAQEEMMQKSGQLSVPVIDIGGEIMIGFDKARLAILFPIEE